MDIQFDREWWKLGIESHGEVLSNFTLNVSSSSERVLQVCETIACKQIRFSIFVGFAGSRINFEDVQLQGEITVAEYFQSLLTRAKNNHGEIKNGK